MSSQHKYRLYALAHAMISPLQRGLQVAHVVGELAAHCEPELGGEAPVLATGAWRDWVLRDKTIIILNGGMSPSIQAAYAEVLRPAADLLRLPAAVFAEDDSLAGAVTAAGIIVPESLWGLERKVIDGVTCYVAPPTEPLRDVTYTPEDPLFALIHTLKTASLAGS
jgi:hypothetical protein